MHVTLQEIRCSSSILCFEVPYSISPCLGKSHKVYTRNQNAWLPCCAQRFWKGRGFISHRIRGFQVEFLKIDGSIILNIHRDPVEMAKVIAINRVAKKIGVKTIAEFVETEETIAKLKDVGIDFAQGFGISNKTTRF